MYAVPYTDPRFGRLVRCECQFDAGLSPTQTKRLSELERELGRYADCTFERFNLRRPFVSVEWDGQCFGSAEQADYLRFAWETARSYAAEMRGWLYLYGPRGGGKSYLAAAVANAAGLRGVAVSYATVPALLDYIRDGYADHSYAARLQDLQDIDLLVLDDFGTEAARDSNAALLFRLLNARYTRNRTTVITSNVHPDDIGCDAEGRLADRIIEMTGGDDRLIWLPVSSYRRLEGGR